MGGGRDQRCRSHAARSCGPRNSGRARRADCRCRADPACRSDERRRCRSAPAAILFHVTFDRFRDTGSLGAGRALRQAAQEPSRRDREEDHSGETRLPGHPQRRAADRCFDRSQRVTLFSNGARVAQGPVSTGTASNPTPLGVFSVIEKDRYHRSNLYGNAPMFYMQRLTWSGVAMHEGPLPGYPASYGRIRLTTDFAARLWPTTRLGVRVIVARSELAPVEFSHPVLFVPKPKPAEPKVAMNVTTDGHVTAPLQMAEATPPSTEAATMRDVTAAAPETPAVADEVPQPVQPASELPHLRRQPESTAMPSSPTPLSTRPSRWRRKPRRRISRKSARVRSRCSSAARKRRYSSGTASSPIFDMPIVIGSRIGRSAPSVHRHGSDR